jgi:hypothetical protein
MRNEIGDFISNSPNDPLDLNSYQISAFLDLLRLVLTKKFQLKDSELDYVDGILKELSDNFFPMSHTTKPLRSLEIHEKIHWEEFCHIINTFRCKLKELNELAGIMESRIQNLDQ